MAGHGPAPKNPDARVRRHKPAEMRVIEAEPSAQPNLPTDFAWPARTCEWWQMWADSPLSAEFTTNDWSELLDTALIHAAFWDGKLALAPELRLRVAKFGATPEDRARLKITFAAAEEADARRDAQPSSRSRYADLKLAQ